jgi:hypothetical protein
LKRTSGSSSNFFFNLKESPSPVLHISRLSVLSSFSLKKTESDSKLDLVLATYTQLETENFLVTRTVQPIKKISTCNYYMPKPKKKNERKKRKAFFLMGITYVYQDN